MPSYYGVLRSSDYLSHYGIKGMKWGIRKARESGNERALDRQYRKANRKLIRLKKKANWIVQNKRKDIADNVTSGTALGGMLSGIGAASARNPVGIGASLAAGALASIPARAVSNHIKKRLLPEGHQKAVDDANTWAKEMNKAFHKTKYQGKAKLFQDAYLRKTRYRVLSEARRGNVMPYLTEYRIIAGSDLARDYASKHRWRKSK